MANRTLLREGTERDDQGMSSEIDLGYWSEKELLAGAQGLPGQEDLHLNPAISSNYLPLLPASVFSFAKQQS